MSPTTLKKYVSWDNKHESYNIEEVGQLGQQT